MPSVTAIVLATIPAQPVLLNVLSDLLFDHLLLDAPQQCFALLKGETHFHPRLECRALPGARADVQQPYMIPGGMLHVAGTTTSEICAVETLHEFQLRPVDSEVVASLILYPYEDAREVLELNGR